MIIYREKQSVLTKTAFLISKYCLGGVRLKSDRKFRNIADIAEITLKMLKRKSLHSINLLPFIAFEHENYNYNVFIQAR